jgi:hypothetical protein
MGASGGPAALAEQLQRQALEIAQHEIENLEIGEVSAADMERIAGWGARMYLLGLGNRATAMRSAAAAPAPEAPRVQVRRRRMNRPTSDKREVREACAANRHRTPGRDGMCACGVFAIDDVRPRGSK